MDNEIDLLKYFNRFFLHFTHENRDLLDFEKPMTIEHLKTLHRKITDIKGKDVQAPEYLCAYLDQMIEDNAGCLQNLDKKLDTKIKGLGISLQYLLDRCLNKLVCDLRRIQCQDLETPESRLLKKYLHRFECYTVELHRKLFPFGRSGPSPFANTI